jgi:DNA-binding NtrC family response regulator
MAQVMKVAIVDDEQDMRQSISQWLALSGFETETFATAGEALKVLSTDYPGIIVTDIKMPGMDGMQFLRKVKGIDSSLPVIMITGHGDVPMAVEAMRLGAFDFLEKPFNPDTMTDLAKKATQSRRLLLDNRQLRRELSSGNSIMEKLIGANGLMERLREDILDLGQADGHVLIEGETGTGKTLVAHALHAVSSRARKKFILFSCAGEEEETLLRCLFGPAGEEDRISVLETARGGTLVLEDIEALSPQLQSRLLKAINTQGDPSETRIIAICNLQEQGKTCEDVLRSDLYYRLATLRIELPPLRSRGEDILTLFTRYSEQFSEEYGCETPMVSAQEAAQLLQAPWPGNVRQLINIAEHAVLQSRRGVGTIASLLMAEREDDRPAVTTEGKPLKEYVEAFERMLIDNTMRRHRGSIARVMGELCLPRRTLNEKMAKYSLSRSDYLG